MRKIYIDITNIPKLTQYTGISRVVSEIIIRLVKENADIVLLSYDARWHSYTVIDSRQLADCFENMVPDKSGCYTDEHISVEDFERDSVFFEINSCWHTLPNRSWLLPQLKNRDIRIIVLIYDLIPIRYPQYMVGQTLIRFMEYLTAHMTYADDIIVNTHAVEEDVKLLFSELGMKQKPVHVIDLGADFTVDNKSDEAADEELLKKLEGKKFLLTVGTIEPRKNHKVIVDAYEKYLSDTDIEVVFVGRIGWQMENLIERIESNPKYDNGIYVFSKVNDTTLARLYSKAYMIVFASYTEGYGLPTIESLINGVPAVCSDIPVMREVGGKYCDYFSPDDSKALADIIKGYYESEEKYAAKRKQLSEEYKPPVWNNTVNSMTALIAESSSGDNFVHKPVKQIVFLSARPAPILATLPYIEEFMPFITDLVVCCPDSMASYMKENYSGRLKLTTVTDDELLAGNTLPADHSTRNFYLRCLAMQLDQIDDEFIMCDDDYRPLRPVTEEVFFKDNKYRGYYFSDISTWKYRIAALFSYDYCHMRTLGFLRKNGFPTLQYSSHQPQIINKIWYRELIAEFPDIKTKGYDEWSTYFNYCAARHPEYYEAVPYVTLSWPNIGGETMGVVPSDYIFENFYKENYYGRGKFNKFSDRFISAEQTAEETQGKIEIAEDFSKKYEYANNKKNIFYSDYEKQFHEQPQISVYFGGGKQQSAVLGCPEKMRIGTDYTNKIMIGISRANNCRMNIMSAVLNLSLQDSDGKIYFNVSRQISPRMEYTFFRFNISGNIRSAENIFMKINISSSGLNEVTEKIIPVDIEDCENI